MCIKHLGLLTKYVTCSESFEGSSFPNPIEARCCVTPKKRMNKEDVAANVWPEHLLCIALIFQMRGFFVLLFDSGRKKRSCDSMLACMTMRSVSSPTSTVLVVVAD